MLKSPSPNANSQTRETELTMNKENCLQQLI